MSPEQCEGKGLIDHRSDVYSLGIVMYELLTGAVPFPGEGFGEVLVKHLTQEPPKPTTVNPNLPPALESIVLHAIEKDRNRRFQNMTELMAALENPEAHLAQWQGLPAYSTAASGAATLQTMPAVKQGRTLALDGGAPAAVPGGPPRPTTLEGAAAEVTFPPTKVPRNRTPLIAVGAAVLALAGVGGWLGLSSSKKPTVEPATSAPQPEVEAPKTVTPPPAGDEVTIVVTSDPLGAKVYRADKSDAETQPTPITFKMHKGDPPFDIQLRAEGYAPQTRTIASDESVKLLVSLAKLPTAPTPKVEEPVVGKKESPPKQSKAEVAKPTTPKVSNATKRGGKKQSPKATEPDPDGVLMPTFGN
jgi:serine/threonine-protein kinase